LASYHGLADRVGVLLEAGADVGAKVAGGHFDGKTAMDLASSRGHTKVVEALERVATLSSTRSTLGEKGELSDLDQLNKTRELVCAMEKMPEFSTHNCRKILTMVTEFLDEGIRVVGAGRSPGLVRDGAKRMLKFMDENAHWITLDVSDPEKSTELRHQLDAYALGKGQAKPAEETDMPPATAPKSIETQVGWHGDLHLENRIVTVEKSHEAEVGGLWKKIKRIPRRVRRREDEQKEVLIDEKGEIQSVEPFKFIVIPAGKFSMGSPAHEVARGDNELRHIVTITSPFELAAVTVTQALWYFVMRTLPENQVVFGGSYPVVNVSWYEAIDFCNRLSDLRGLPLCYSGTDNTILWDRSRTGYRLPTEAEWEYAARAGTTTPYNTGRTLSHKQACFSSMQPARVGQYPPNGWGLYDMHGNVFEWVWDWYGDYSSESVNNPTGPQKGLYRTFRGGGWYHRQNYCRSAYRYCNDPGHHDGHLGFRLARSLP